MANCDRVGRVLYREVTVPYRGVSQCTAACQLPRLSQTRYGTGAMRNLLHTKGPSISHPLPVPVLDRRPPSLPTHTTIHT